MIRQQEWKIERLTKDNRALEASNCELRSQLDAIREENLQVGAQGAEAATVAAGVAVIAATAAC